VLTADTNLFVYNVDPRDPIKYDIACSLVDALRAIAAPVAFQVVGEFYSALTRKLRRSTWEAAQAARNLTVSFPMFGTSGECIERALAEASAGRFSYWDALLLTSADLAGCTVLLSEDMADGARLGGIEVVQPFGPGGLSDRAQAALSTRGAPR
jgi:predicted nucleic acid-binding protein